MGDVLELDAVSIVRGGKTLLDAVDWDVSDGDRWIVLGPNGAGKSTLLQIAGARMHPTSGTAEILGERLGAVDVFELRPRIGMTSALLAAQIPADESVVDTVVTAAWGVTGRWRERYEGFDEDRARELLGEWGMGSLADRRFGTLSSGEQKRVLIARALMTDPELLLLDEPAAGLDVGGREDLIGRLADLLADPYAPAIVMVTHHVEEIAPGFTHALLLRDGAVVAAGALDDVLTSENLSRTYGIALTLTRDGDRWHAVAAR
ncbi:iron ABC transporter ATP-binding protein [Tersicoccus solisilvae]|uniref:Iron ABC transporter ATP-binding protein n=1 Tax=Tersicoccus solisilvae TaxID=1882339 RepID=A0ABQ1P123_9MICC|nr:ABC transporter ATP-binding protein [Tersicoccus solisilvae]GGC88293.1 iron ABC transporter ATP-binding protein [Tersicoccus solisilvae]